MSHQQSEDSILLDLASTQGVASPTKSTLSDDVPLCIADDLLTPKDSTAELLAPTDVTADLLTPTNVTADLLTPMDSTADLLTPKDSDPARITSHDEPLLAVGELQPNLTLNLLIQTQNDPVTELVSPPPACSSPKAPCEPRTASTSISTKLCGEHFESFLSYLDDSVGHVTTDPDKSGEVLLNEVESVIQEAESNVRKRKESQTSMSSVEALKQFDTGNGQRCLHLLIGATMSHSSLGYLTEVLSPHFLYEFHIF